MTDKVEWSLANRLRRRALIATGLITLALAGVVAVHYGSDLQELRHRSLHTLAERFAKDAADAGKHGDWAIINDRHPVFRGHPESYSWAVIDTAGDIIAASPNRPSGEEIGIAAGPFPDVWTSATRTGGWIGGRAIESGGPGAYVVIEIHQDTAGLLPVLIAEEVFLHIIIPVVPFMLVLLFGLDATLRQTLAPMRRLSDASAQIKPDQRFDPININDVPQEISGIAASLNAMLASLNAARERERLFIAEAAHSLRTPLSALKARLELDGAQAAPEQLRSEVDGLVRLANRLLISADETRFSVDAASQADLVAIARNVVIQLTPVALSASVDLGMETEQETLTVTGNPDAIREALICLAENAVQFTPPGKDATIRVTSSPPTLTVLDSGAGFAMGDAAARSTAGRGDVHAGLGLRIAHQVAKAHKAEIEISRAPEGGAAVHFRFPAAGPHLTGTHPP